MYSFDSTFGGGIRIGRDVIVNGNLNKEVMMGKKRIIEVEKMPGTGSPLSQAVFAGDFLFCSGQTGRDPKQERLVEGGVRAQAAQCLENIKNVLEAAGLTLEDIVKMTVFITDMGGFGTLNEVYRTFFPSNPPARSCIGVKELPGGALVEMEAVAFKA